MMPEPAHDLEPINGRYTIRLNGRDGRKPVLTYEEAMAMYALGFRFSIFDPVNGEFNVSPPYTTYEHMDRGTLTYVRPLPKGRADRAGKRTPPAQISENF